MAPGPSGFGALFSFSLTGIAQRTHPHAAIRSRKQEKREKRELCMLSFLPFLLFLIAKTS